MRVMNDREVKNERRIIRGKWEGGKQQQKCELRTVNEKEVKSGKRVN